MQELPINQVITRNCLEVMREFPAESIDAVITDPPYMLPAKISGTRKVFTRNLSELIIIKNMLRLPRLDWHITQVKRD